MIKLKICLPCYYILSFFIKTKYFYTLFSMFRFYVLRCRKMMCFSKIIISGSKIIIDCIHIGWHNERRGCYKTLCQNHFAATSLYFSLFSCILNAYALYCRFSLIRLMNGVYADKFQFLVKFLCQFS